MKAGSRARLSLSDNKRTEVFPTMASTFSFVTLVVVSRGSP